MTKEEVLQRANDYCSERSYDESTLTSEFKDKFADFFVKRNPEGDINDETILADLKFNLDTARSAAAKGIAFKQQAFTTAEEDYKKQIAELNKKLGDKPTPTPPAPTIPKEVQDQLDELKRFKDEESKKAKFEEVVGIAKKNVREDLLKSFERYAQDFTVNLNETSEEQAKRLFNRFQEIFKDSIGDIKPFKPRINAEKENEYLNSLPKIKV